ncbi:MAG: hypothetical protein JXD23_06875 [Spirochaetales bacterium]|nr:hypothetical protein [Spirochaetales bacterium]
MQNAAAENNTAFSPSFTLGLTPSACLSLGRLTAATIGGTLRFTWRPIRDFSLDAAASARWLIGHDFSLTVSCLWSPLRSGAWSLGFGASLGLSHESRMIGYTQDDPPPDSGVYGPYGAAAAAIVAAPIQLRLEKVDFSILRISGGVLFGAWVTAPIFTVELFEIAVHL